MSAARKRDGQLVVSAFLSLLSRGFWPIAIYPAGATIPGRSEPAKGKEPIGKAWGTERWDVDRFHRARRSHPRLGLGLGLGPGRGPGGRWLIDVEGDGPEAEASRAKLFGGELVETMGWGSARGGHGLHTCDGDRLAAILPGLSHLEGKGSLGAGVYKSPELPGLELRIGGFKPDGTVKQFQSVCPPTPGTDGRPREWAGPATVAEVPGAFYAFLAGLAERIAAPEVPEAPAAPSRAAAAGSGRWTPEARAAAYLQACEPCIQGQDGSGKAIKVACKAGPGFDLAPDTLMALLRDVYNPTCQPPWSEGELLHKVEDAYRIEKRRGWLLDEPPRSASRKPAPAAPKAEKATGSGRPTLKVVKDDDQAEPPGPVGDLPEIVITADMWAVNGEAIRALSQDPEVYCRGAYLVTVNRDNVRSRFITRPPGSPHIAAMAKATIREYMTKTARWVKMRKDDSGKWISVPSIPPDWSAAAVEARGSWPDVRPLEGITETPVLLADGSILDKPGYDPLSGLLYEPNCDFPPIPGSITQDDARKAAWSLLKVVADFPFAVTRADGEVDAEEGDGGLAHRCAWLAGVLTPLARYAIDGPCPLFLVDANVPGAGKSKLTDIAAILATGRDAARTSYPDSDEEMRKSILAIALEGDRLMLLDNVATGAALGCASLDAVLTATSIKGRVLGRTEMTRELPIYTVWYANGNNIAIKGDLLRRVVPYRLESQEEHPEERKDFAIKGELKDYVKAHRGRLVVAALTVLRGYILAGRPERDLTPMDYPSWCNVVRNAIHWATGIDPCSTRRGLIANDPEMSMIRGLLTGLDEIRTEKFNARAGFTASELHAELKKYSNSDKFDTIKDTLANWSKDDQLPSPKAIGRHFAKYKGRVADKLCLKSIVHNNTFIWKIVSME